MSVEIVATDRLTEIIRLHNEVMHAVRLTVDTAIDVGRLLVEQKAELDKLAEEFGDRVFFAQITVLKGEFIDLCPEVRSRYHILWVPTTLLIVDGQERKRWELVHKAVAIREEIKKVLLESSLARRDPR